jgi:hypothetical protein
MAETTKRYLIHSHLKVEDRLTIGFFTFTFRQAAILFCALGLAYTFWQYIPPGFFLVRIALAALIILSALALAFIRKQGRTLDVWVFVWLRYFSQPTRYRWRRLPDPALLPATQAQLAKAARMQHEDEEDH